MSLYATGVVLKEAPQIICFSSSWGCRRSKPIFKNASLWQKSLKLKQEEGRGTYEEPCKRTGGHLEQEKDAVSLWASRQRQMVPEGSDAGDPCPSLAMVLPTGTQRAQCGKLGLSHCPESPAGVAVHRKCPPAGVHWRVSSATSWSGWGPRSGCKQCLEKTQPLLGRRLFLWMIQGFLELRQARAVYSRVTTGMLSLSGSLFSEVRTLV